MPHQDGGSQTRVKIKKGQRGPNLGKKRQKKFPAKRGGTKGTREGSKPHLNKEVELFTGKGRKLKAENKTKESRPTENENGRWAVGAGVMEQQGKGGRKHPRTRRGYAKKNQRARGEKPTKARETSKKGDCRQVGPRKPGGICLRTTYESEGKPGRKVSSGPKKRKECYSQGGTYRRKGTTCNRV